MDFITKLTELFSMTATELVKQKKYEEHITILPPKESIEEPA